MSQTVGSVKGQELWLRCPDCGDTHRNPHKGHLSVNLTKSVFYCVRCGYSGSLTTRQLLELAIRYDLGALASVPASHVIESVEETAGSPRFSALKRQHYTDSSDVTWDVFEIRDPIHNEQVGQYLRNGSQSLIMGESGLGWVGDRLISSADQPLRVVEGPYDVLERRDVCCYGFLRSQILKQLRGHYVLLCPDGDVWQDEFLREKFKRFLSWALHSPKAPEVIGLEMLPDGKDPDECHPADRLFVPRSRLLRTVLSSKQRRFALAGEYTS